MTRGYRRLRQVSLQTQPPVLSGAGDFAQPDSRIDQRRAGGNQSSVLEEVNHCPIVTEMVISFLLRLTRSL
jgi:hypothetical protein